MSQPPHSVETSIVIRTYNEERDLPGLLDSLDSQCYRAFETIVVDSGSVDLTRKIAAPRVDRLIRISSHDFTFGFSLNAGIKEARGRFVVLVSAHTVPCDDRWLEELIRPLRDDGTAMTYGGQVGVRSSKFSEIEDLRRTFGPDPEVGESIDPRVNNANAAIRRDLWLERPFDEDLPGLEDIEWARHWIARGRRVSYVPNAFLKHIHRESWGQVRNRFYREAVAARRMSIRGRRHLPWDLAKEVVNVLSDLTKAVNPVDNPSAARLRFMHRVTEILLYRFNKYSGTVRGMITPHPIETREEREGVMFDRMTEAVVIHGPGRASLERVGIPEVKPGDVLIRVANVAVCATDIEILEGKLGYYADGKASYPIVPGHEFSGEIVALGPKVDTLREGDRVVVECIQSCGICEACRADNFIGCPDRGEVGVLGINGAYSEYMVTPAHFVHRIPDGIDMRTAVLTEPLAVVLKGLRRIEPAVRRNGDGAQWAVLGSGPLGHLCVMALAQRGHSVVAFDRNPKRRALLERRQIPTSDDLRRLGEFDAIVEVTGDPEVLESALHESRPNAALLLLGLPYGPRAFSFETVAAYDKTVIGSIGSTAKDFESAIALLPHLDLSSYFGCSMPLSDFAAGWEKSRGGDVLKVIFDVQPPRDANGGGSTAC